MRETPREIHDNEVRPCDRCGQGLAAGGIDFFLVKVQQAIVDHEGVRTLGAMNQLLGGAYGIARTMSPTTTVARVVPGARELMICRTCVYAGADGFTVSEAWELEVKGGGEQ